MSSKADAVVSDIAVKDSTDDLSMGVRLLKASGLVAIGNISGRLIALLIAIASARLLTEVEFGMLGIVQGTLSMFGITAGLSLGLGATRYVAIYRVTDLRRARGIAVVVLSVGAVSSILTSAALVWMAPWLADNSLHNAELVAPLRWAAFQLLLSAEYGFVAGILTGAERFGITATANAFQNIVILLGSLILIPAFRVSGAIGAQCFGLAATLAFGLWCIRDVFQEMSWRTVKRNVRQEGRLLLNFCLPSVLAGLIIMPATWLALMLIARGPDGYAQVAFFSAADRFRLALAFIAGFVGTALLPILSRAYGKDGAGGGAVSRGIELGLIGTSILIVPLSAALAFAGPQIMLLFGRAYQVNWAVLLPVIAWAGAGAIGSTVGTALLAHGKQWFLFFQQTAYGLSLLIMTYLLRRFGGAGLALAHLFTVTLLIAWSVPVLRYLNALTSRAMLILLGSTGAVFVICSAAWVCPAQWRLTLAVPVVVLAVVLPSLILVSGAERDRFRSLLRLSRLGVWVLGKG